MNSKQLNNLLDFVFPAYVAFQFLVWTPIVYWIISPYFMDGLSLQVPSGTNIRSGWLTHGCFLLSVHSSMCCTLTTV